MCRAGVSRGVPCPRSLLVSAASPVGSVSGWTSMLGLFVWLLGPLAVPEVLGSGHLPPAVKSSHTGEFCLLMKTSEEALASSLLGPSPELP